MKILLIEDDKYKREDLRTYIHQEFPDVWVDEVKSYKTGVLKVLDGTYDLLLVDMTIPTYENLLAELV